MLSGEKYYRTAELQGALRITLDNGGIRIMRPTAYLSPYFTHVSEDDFAIIHENLNGGQRTTRDRLVPSCVFIDPELARVGINESQARERGVAYRVASVPVASGWRPWTISEKRGFMKTLIDTRSDRILGFTAFGPEAGELMGTESYFQRQYSGKKTNSVLGHGYRLRPCADRSCPEHPGK